MVVSGGMAEAFNVTADYLIGCSEARTKEPKLKSICDKIELSDKPVDLLFRGNFSDEE